MIKENEALREIFNYKLFFVLYFIVGISFSILIPTWETPDECTHVNMIGKGIGIDNLGDMFFSQAPCSFQEITRNTDVSMKWSDWTFYLNQKVDKQLKNDICLNPYIFTHLPSSLGILLGIVLGLPVIIILICGEIFNLIFFLGMTILAYRLMPIKKDILLVLCAMPMCIQQASCLGYDAVCLSLIFVLIAYELNLIYKKQSIYIYDIFAIFAILAWISYIKVPYIVLIVTIFALPADKMKIGFKDKYLSKKMINIIVSTACLLTVIVVPVLMHKFDSNLIVHLLNGCFKHPRQTCRLYISTFKTFGGYLIESFVGQLGWLDTYYPKWYIYAVVLLLIVLGLVKDIECKLIFTRLCYVKIIMFISFITVMSFTMISMLNHTISVILYGQERGDILYNMDEVLYQIPYIGGLQGRYFIPAALLLFICLPEVIEENRTLKKMVVVIYFAVTVVVSMYVLMNRYWM